MDAGFQRDSAGGKEAQPAPERQEMTMSHQQWEGLLGKVVSSPSPEVFKSSWITTLVFKAPFDADSVTSAREAAGKIPAPKGKPNSSS